MFSPRPCDDPVDAELPDVSNSTDSLYKTLLKVNSVKLAMFPSKAPNSVHRENWNIA